MLRLTTAVSDGITRHPTRLVSVGFAVAIAAGTLLLVLPVARAGPGAAPSTTAPVS
jgi:trk system potassium uptake protein TrkH